MPSVGDNIDAYCLKCKLILAHVILFKVDGVVNRVKCKTCGAEHKYRPPVAAERKTVREKRPAERKSVSATKTAQLKQSESQAALQWDLKIRNRQPDAPVRDYAIHETYKVNDVIHHPKFGMGFVEKIISDKSMQVLFNDSIKLLAMNVT